MAGVSTNLVIITWGVCSPEKADQAAFNNMGASPAAQALPGFTCTVEGCRKFHEYFRDWEAFLRHYRTHHPDLHLRLVGLPRRSVLWTERWAYCAIFSQLTPTAVLFKHNAQRGDPVAEDFLSKVAEYKPEEYDESFSILHVL